MISGGGLEIGANQLPDLQGLFLHHQQQQQQQQQQQPQIKREPEDLSHHRGKGNGGLDKGRPKVVLVTPGSSSSELVVDVVNNNAAPSIKEEFIQSPQHGSRSINGTPSSTSPIIGGDLNQSTGAPIELIAADGLKAGTMYSGHIFATMPNAQPHSGGSGSPSPNTYADHSQYTSATALATSAGYITTSAGRANFADPYYREYFAAEPGPYTTQVRQPVYADSADANANSTSSFVERYVRQTNAYHNSKGVISAAGLTVDLPSPDSGIGADTITPRDQNAIQQVCSQFVVWVNFFSHCLEGALKMKSEKRHMKLGKVPNM